MFLLNRDARTKVIVITAREDLAARATAMAIGPVAFFMKPWCCLRIAAQRL
jgi:FixJ family two-component response regulator